MTLKTVLFFTFQRALHPPEVKHERLFVVSVLGFFVNLIGIFVFHHGAAAGKLFYSRICFSKPCDNFNQRLGMFSTATLYYQQYTIQ